MSISNRKKKDSNFIVTRFTDKTKEFIPFEEFLRVEDVKKILTNMLLHPSSYDPASQEFSYRCHIHSFLEHDTGFFNMLSMTFTCTECEDRGYQTGGNLMYMVKFYYPDIKSNKKALEKLEFLKTFTYVKQN